MRPFEAYLIIGCLVAILWPALFGVRPRRGLVAVSVPVLVAAQWVAEGYRWPLLSVYVVALGLAVGDFVAVERQLPWARRVGRGVFGPLGLGLMAAPVLLFPVPELPPPSGPLAIGTSVVELVHPELEERYGPAPGGKRHIVAQVWYPAEAEVGEAEPWTADIDQLGPALARRLRLPAFFFGSARYSESHAQAGAPALEGGYPVVVFSHDWEGFRSIALPQVEDLVSHGYVVVAIDHPHLAVLTMVGGEPVPLDGSALDGADGTARLTAVAEAVEVMAADIDLVLAELSEGPEGAFGPAVAGADPESVGLWGHGLGGAAALWVCIAESACDAVLALDPRAEGLPDTVLATTAIRPMMLVRSADLRDTDADAILRGIVARSQALSYWVGISGAESADLVAAPLISPIAPQLGLRGDIPADRMVAINRRLTTGFFDHALTGTGPAALETFPFVEVSIEVVDRRSG